MDIQFYNIESYVYFLPLCENFFIKEYIMQLIFEIIILL